MLRTTYKQCLTYIFSAMGKEGYSAAPQVSVRVYVPYKKTLVLHNLSAGSHGDFYRRTVVVGA